MHDSMLVTLCKVSELYFRFLGTNGFHAKAENERFNVAVWRCRQNLKYENSTLPFDRLRQKIAPNACPTCCTIIFTRSSNQIIDFWRCRCSRRSLNSLKMRTHKQGAQTHKERKWRTCGACKGKRSKTRAERAKKKERNMRKAGA